MEQDCNASIKEETEASGFLELFGHLVQPNGDPLDANEKTCGVATQKLITQVDLWPACEYAHTHKKKAQIFKCQKQIYL